MSNGFWLKEAKGANVILGFPYTKLVVFQAATENGSELGKHSASLPRELALSGADGRRTATENAVGSDVVDGPSDAISVEPFDRFAVGSRRNYTICVQVRADVIDDF